MRQGIEPSFTSRCARNGHVCKINSRKLRNHRGARSNQIQGSRSGRHVFQRDVVHDDEFIESGKRPFAHHRMGRRKDALVRRQCFDLGEDVPLRRQQKSNRAVAGFEVADIRSQNGVQIALRVGPGKRKERRKFVSTSATALRAAEYSALKSPNREGSSVPKIFANFRPGGAMQSEQRGFERHGCNFASPGARIHLSRVRSTDVGCGNGLHMEPREMHIKGH